MVHQIEDYATIVKTKEANSSMKHQKVLPLTLAICLMVALIISASAMPTSNGTQIISPDESDYIYLPLEEIGIEKLRASGYSEEFIAAIPTDILEKIGSATIAQKSIAETEFWTAIEAIDAIDVEAVMQARAEEIASQITVVDEAGNPICSHD